MAAFSGVLSSWPLMAPRGYSAHYNTIQTIVSEEDLLSMDWEELKKQVDEEVSHDVEIIKLQIHRELIRHKKRLLSKVEKVKEQEDGEVGV